MQTLFFILFLMQSIMANKQELMQQLQSDIQKAEFLLKQYPQLQTKYAAQLASLQEAKHYLQQQALNEPVRTKMASEEDIPKGKLWEKFIVWYEDINPKLDILKKNYTNAPLRLNAVSNLKNLLNKPESNPILTSIGKKIAEECLASETVGEVCGTFMEQLDEWKSNFNEWYSKPENKSIYAKISDDNFSFPEIQPLLDIILDVKAYEAEKKAKAEQAKAEAAKAAEAEKANQIRFNNELMAWTTSCAAIPIDIDSYKVKEINVGLLKSNGNYFSNKWQSPLGIDLYNGILENVGDGMSLLDAILKVRLLIDNLGDKYTLANRADFYEYWLKNGFQHSPKAHLVETWLISAVPIASSDYASSIANWYKEEMSDSISSFEPSTTFSKKNLLKQLKIAFSYGNGAAYHLYAKHFLSSLEALPERIEQEQLNNTWKIAANQAANQASTDFVAWVQEDVTRPNYIVQFLPKKADIHLALRKSRWLEAKTEWMGADRLGFAFVAEWQPVDTTGSEVILDSGLARGAYELLPSLAKDGIELFIDPDDALQQVKKVGQRIPEPSRFAVLLDVKKQAYSTETMNTVWVHDGLVEARLLSIDTSEYTITYMGTKTVPVPEKGVETNDTYSVKTPLHLLWEIAGPQTSSGSTGTAGYGVAGVEYSSSTSAQQKETVEMVVSLLSTYDKKTQRTTTTLAVEEAALSGLGILLRRGTFAELQGMQQTTIVRK